MKKLFVVGAPRSGTTYLGRALGLASQTAYFEESGAFSVYGARRYARHYKEILSNHPEFDHFYWKHSLQKIADRARSIDRLGILVHQMILHSKLKAYDLAPSSPLIYLQKGMLNGTEAMLEEKLCSEYREIEKHEHPRQIFGKLFGDFIQLSNKENLVEKTPGQIAYVPVIASLFPDAKFAVICREKKDTIASYIRTFGKAKEHFSTLLPRKLVLKNLCRKCLYYERIENWLGRQTYCRRISYNEMVERPLETVSSILEWAGLSLDTEKHGSLFSPSRASSHWEDLGAEDKSIAIQYLKLE